jgi:hypothetical protein
LRKSHTKDLPSISRWAAQHGGEVGIWAYLGQQGASLAVAYSYLFWPTFVEVEGCTLLSERYDQANFRQWWERLSGHVPEVEKVINHVHLWDLFPEEEGLPEGALEELACVMGKCWQQALTEAYPAREFEVRVSTSEEDYGPTVCFASKV